MFLVVMISHTSASLIMNAALAAGSSSEQGDADVEADVDQQAQQQLQQQQHRLSLNKPGSILVVSASLDMLRGKGTCQVCVHERDKRETEKERRLFICLNVWPLSS
jgi:hypothetical protein